MKNLSFALALALICISMFSCGEKSVITPLVEDFKITTFSPASGFTASDITLFGENLDKDSIVSVAFGDQTAEILSRSNDSLIVKVPRIAVGKFDITVKTKTQSYLYDKQFEVLLLENVLDFTKFTYYEVSVKGLNVKYDKVHTWHGGNPQTDPPGTTHDTLTDPAYSVEHKSTTIYKIEEYEANNFVLSEKTLSPPFGIYSLHFEIDKKKNKFVTFKLSWQSGNYYDANSYCRSFGFDLSNVIYTVSDDLSTVSVLLNNVEMKSSMSNFRYSNLTSNTTGSHYNSYENIFLELLGINDDATIEIKFTK
ncbi:MAG: IPT/TIG domain-containing protein [bacterium]